MDSENTEMIEQTNTPPVEERDCDCAVFLKKGQLSETPAVPAEELPLIRGNVSRFISLTCTCNLEEYVVFLSFDSSIVYFVSSSNL